MRINVDFAFYVEEYFGSNMDMEKQFPRIAMDAEQIVNKMTYGRIHKYDLHENDLEAVITNYPDVALRVRREVTGC